jgi:hypothetical protein
MKTSAKYKNFAFLISEYQRGVSAFSLSKTHHIAGKTLLKIFRENGVAIRGLGDAIRSSPVHSGNNRWTGRKLSSDQWYSLIDDHKAGMGIVALSEKYSLAGTAVRKLLKGENAFRPPAYFSYTLDESFFEVIDTAAKAYWLGFIFADGCVIAGRSPSVRLTLKASDSEHLELFSLHIGSNRNIKISDNFYKHNGVLLKTKKAEVDIRSQKMFNDLCRLGCLPRKTYLDSCVPSKIPDHLFPDFVRGYFDGDGCINFHCRKNRDGYIDSTWSVVGTPNFLSGINAVLTRCLGFKISNLAKLNGCYRLAFSGPNHVLALYDFLYPNDSVLRLQRKFDTFSSGVAAILNQGDRRARSPFPKARD